MTNKAPSYQWYPDKGLADTNRLSWESKGIYRTLLDIIWMQYQDTCTIPNDDVWIASELGCALDTWKRARAEIQNPLRPLLLEEPAGLLSKGLLKYRESQEKRRQQLAENGRKGGRPKNLNNQKDIQTPSEKGEPVNLNESLSSPSSSPSPIASSIPKEKEPIHQTAFDEFWKAYPKKIGKQKAIAAWAKNGCEKISGKIMAALEDHKESDQWTRDGGKYISHPTSWLNQHRWEDVLEVETPTETLTWTAYPEYLWIEWGYMPCWDHWPEYDRRLSPGEWQKKYRVSKPEYDPDPTSVRDPRFFDEDGNRKEGVE